MIKTAKHTDVVVSDDAPGCPIPGRTRCTCTTRPGALMQELEDAGVTGVICQGEHGWEVA